MFLNDNFKILLKIFYWSGLAPFPEIDKEERCYSFIVSVIISSLVNVSLIVVSITFQFYNSYGNIATIVNYAFIGTLSLTNLCANVQCYSYKPMYRKIVCRIKKIETNFTSKFSEEMQFGAAAYRYKLKILIISVILLIVCILELYESGLQSSYKMYVINLLIILTQWMSVLVLLHALLYIFVVHMFIVKLNRCIRNAPICFYPSSKIEFLTTVKLMHMDIYRLMMQINRFFSWTLPLLIIHLAIQATYACYWIFLTLQVEWNLLYITRRYYLIAGPILENSQKYALRDRLKAS